MKPEIWRERADATTRFCLTTMYDERVGRFHAATPADPKALPWEFMWGDGVAFSMLVGARDRARLSRFFDGLDGYWDARAVIPGYDAYLSSPGNSDKYYDDNDWMVLTFVEGYELTGERKYLNRAASAMRFVLSGWDEKLGGGIYWRENKTSKNTCSNGPSATAALALANHLSPGYFVPFAERIVAWTKKTLQDTDGIYFDNTDLSGKVERTKWTYNTALMLRAHLGLYRAKGDRAHLAEAVKLAEASEREFVEKSTGAFRDEANFSHLLVEAYLDLYKETKAPFLKARAEACGTFAWNHLRDPADGGHFTKWRIEPGRKQERKTLMDNASVARMYWLLAKYI